MISLTDAKQKNKIGIATHTELSEDAPIVFILGMFDGVHSGHRRLFAKALSMAQKYNATATVLTFANHPMEIISPDKIPHLLTTTREKAMLAAECGVSQMALVWFDDMLASLSPKSFIENYILPLNVKGIVCGYNYRFGKNAEGDSEFLSDYLEDYGIETAVEPRYAIDGINVSSTYIRTLVESGDIKSAARFLSGEYVIGGEVEHGFERGRGLGFPTANIVPRPEKLLPPNGVYATKTIVDGHEYVSVTNIGTNPTYGNGEKTVETFIEGFCGDIYGKYITVRFYEMLRGEQRFSSCDELSRQIAEDKKRAVSFFS